MTRVFNKYEYEIKYILRLNYDESESIKHMIKMYRIRTLCINYYYETLKSLHLADPFRSVHPDVENIVLILGVEVPEGQL